MAEPGRCPSDRIYCPVLGEASHLPAPVVLLCGVSTWLKARDPRQGHISCGLPFGGQLSSVLSTKASL